MISFMKPRIHFHFDCPLVGITCLFCAAEAVVYLNPMAWTTRYSLTICAACLVCCAPLLFRMRRYIRVSRIGVPTTVVAR